MSVAKSGEHLTLSCSWKLIAHVFIQYVIPRARNTTEDKTQRCFYSWNLWWKRYVIGDVENSNHMWHFPPVEMEISAKFCHCRSLRIHKDHFQKLWWGETWPLISPGVRSHAIHAHLGAVRGFVRGWFHHSHWSQISLLGHKESYTPEAIEHTCACAKIFIYISLPGTGTQIH